nr:unnamed protein product [Callosobruchus chinensis]
MADSTPEDSWFRMKCKLKRNNLMNLEAAEEEMERMLAQQFVNRKKRQRMLLPQRRVYEDNDAYNSMAAVCLLTEKLDKILVNQSLVIQNQHQIIQNQELMASKETQVLILQQFAKLEAMMDSIGNKLCQTPHSEAIPDKIKEHFDSEVEQINNLESLVELEKKLEDPRVMEHLIETLSLVCGRKGNENGLNSCYLLVDILFSREFMTTWSWAGGARDNREKIAFKMYKKIIYLFFRIVQLSDHNFTLKECEEFFKSVNKNSTKRNESSMSRN